MFLFKDKNNSSQIVRKSSLGKHLFLLLCSFFKVGFLFHQRFYCLQEALLPGFMRAVWIYIVA
jgi:hypothetical protein